MAEDQDQNQEGSKKGDKKKPASNFENYHELRKEFKDGKMVTQKLNALRIKLIQLYKTEKIKKDDFTLLLEILKKGRLKRTLTSPDTYLLNQIEYDECENIAVVKTDDCPANLHLKKDLECRFREDEEYDDGKGKPDSVGRWIVYVPRVIPPRHQLKYSAAVKLSEKQPLTEGDEPAPKTVIHRLMFKKKEFERWFEVSDPEILNKGSVDPSHDTGDYEF